MSPFQVAKSSGELAFVPCVPMLRDCPLCPLGNLQAVPSYRQSIWRAVGDLYRFTLHIQTVICLSPKTVVAEVVASTNNSITRLLVTLTKFCRISSVGHQKLHWITWVPVFPSCYLMNVNKC